jgi:hypothetical protein
MFSPVSAVIVSTTFCSTAHVHDSLKSRLPISSMHVWVALLPWSVPCCHVSPRSSQYVSVVRDVLVVHQGTGTCVVFWGLEYTFLTITQLYVGEACCAFLFGVIIGMRSLLVTSPPILDRSSRALCRQCLQSQRLGGRLLRNHGPHHIGVYACRVGYRGLRYRRGASKGVHVSTLEKPSILARSSHDMGASLDVIDRYIVGLKSGYHRAGLSPQASYMRSFPD